MAEYSKLATILITLLSKIPVVKNLLLFLGKGLKKIDGGTTEILGVLWALVEILGALGALPPDVVSSLRPALAASGGTALAKRIVKLLPYLTLVTDEAKKVTETDVKQ